LISTQASRATSTRTRPTPRSTPRDAAPDSAASAGFDRRRARAPSTGPTFGRGARARRALDARGRVPAARRVDACQAPENARSFLRDARTSYGFSLAYDRAYAAAHPFEADLSLGEDARFLRSADPRVVRYHRDASASCLHVQHGENATKSVALESAGPDFLAASPLAGQEKRAKFPTSKAPISADFHSFRLIFGRAIISRNGLEAWMLFLERARAEHAC